MKDWDCQFSRYQSVKVIVFFSVTLCSLVRKFQGLKKHNASTFKNLSSTLNITDADASETLILQGIISHKTVTVDEKLFWELIFIGVCISIRLKLTN